MDTWTRWPLATVRPAQLLATQHGAPEHLLDSPYEVSGYAVDRNQAAGVDYRLARHAGSWRSLGDLVTVSPDHRLSPTDIDAAAFQRWARAYGPLLNRERPVWSFGGNELELALQCHRLAWHWSEPDDAGVSRWRPDSLTGQRMLDARNAAIWAGGQLRMLNDAARPPTLYAALLDQALEAMVRKTPMRRCAACGHWITATRSDRLYCDTTCRTHATSGRGLRGRFREG